MPLSLRLRQKWPQLWLPLCNKRVAINPAQQLRLPHLLLLLWLLLPQSLHRQPRPPTQSYHALDVGLASGSLSVVFPLNIQTIIINISAPVVQFLTYSFLTPATHICDSNNILEYRSSLSARSASAIHFTIYSWNCYRCIVVSIDLSIILFIF
jgi:hypothetical protein